MKEFQNLNIYDEEKLMDIFINNLSMMENLNIEDIGNIPQGFCRSFIQFIANIDLPEIEAKELFNKIVGHRLHLTKMAGKHISFIVAAMDYLSEQTELLKNPRIIEYSLLEIIRKRSNEDPKTGCYNSGFLNEFAVKEINRAKRYNQQFSLIIIDIDNFKKINDQFGHIFGDQVLKDFAAIIKNSIRNEDCLFRFGGDEFVIILPQTGRTGSRCLAEKIKINIKPRCPCLHSKCQRLGPTFLAIRHNKRC